MNSIVNGLDYAIIKVLNTVRAYFRQEVNNRLQNQNEQLPNHITLPRIALIV